MFETLFQRRLMISVAEILAVLIRAALILVVTLLLDLWNLSAILAVLFILGGLTVWLSVPTVIRWVFRK